MPRFTVLHGERQEGRRENGEDADVKKYVEMLTQAGFETAVSHVQRSARAWSWRDGPRLKDMLLGTKEEKLFYSNRRLWREPEETKTSESQ